MQQQDDGRTTADDLAAVAFVLDWPVADLKGFIVIGVGLNDEAGVVANLPSKLWVVSALADVIHQQIRELAEDEPIGMVP